MKISISAKRRTLKETETVLKQVLENSIRESKELEPAKDNPTVSAMYQAKKVEINLVEAIIDYINGSSTAIYFYTR
jgi:hypothetical protein